MNFKVWLENYCSGNCDVFALALNRLFGWQLATIRGYFTEDDEEFYEDCHAIAITPNKKLADFNGIHPNIESLRNKCVFNQPVSRIELVPVSPQEMTEIFTTENISEKDIEQAVQYIKNNKGKWNI